MSVKRLGKGLDALIRSNEVKNKEDSVSKKGTGSISKNKIKTYPSKPKSAKKTL